MENWLNPKLQKLEELRLALEQAAKAVVKIIEIEKDESAKKLQEQCDLRESEETEQESEQTKPTENKDSANARLHNIYYYDSKGKKIITDMIKIPQKCGDCPFISTKETYSHYDDLDGFDVYNNVTICKANGMTIETHRSEGSLRFDYGYEDRALENKPINCPLKEPEETEQESEQTKPDRRNGQSRKEIKR